ncbi:MAG: DUF4388 domain-containing protein [Deltaproteobacteria bacterium]|nr:DUF4388 domain-containing protein [Deltaproteobacteria bacterium]
MSLTGKIGDFGLADIFQLIGQQQRSGTLTMESGKKMAKVILVNGMISKAFPASTSSKADPFAGCLSKARLIREDALRRALVKQGESLKTLEEICLEEKLLSADQIVKINENLIFETMYDVLQWKTGEYEFTVKEESHDERFGDLLSIEHILLDVLRMIDEEPELRGRIPDHHIVLERAEGKDAGQGASELAYDEKTVYRLINGANTVQDIVDQSLLGRFNALKALGNLINDGLVKKVAGERGIRKEAAPGQRILPYISYGGLPIIILLLVGLKFFIPSPPASDDTAAFAPQIAVAKTRILKLENALNLYYLKSGSFPVSLEDLVKSNLVRPGEIEFPLGADFGYTLQDDGTYRLTYR